MSVNWVGDIWRMHDHYGFHEKFKNLTVDQLKEFIQFRIKFLQEELDEMKTAESADGVVDALIDLCVVAIGTLDAFNADSHTSWDRVLEANMAKQAGVNPSRPNPLGLPDLIKPDGWTAPMHDECIGDFYKLFETADA